MTPPSCVTILTQAFGDGEYTNDCVSCVVSEAGIVFLLHQI